MNHHRQHANDLAREVIVSFRDITTDARAARLTSLSHAALTSETKDSSRGQALISFRKAATYAVALDTTHVKGDFTVTAEAHGNMRETAILAAGAALFAYMVSVIPVSIAGLLSGAAATV